MKNSLGIVSNCWQLQFAAGVSIEQLVERGLELGLRWFELRQGSLGDCETTQQIPLPDRLADLAARFPEASFNLAVEMPLITGLSQIDDQFAETCVDAAAGLASSAAAATPHLRIVDLAGHAVATGQHRTDALAALSQLHAMLLKHSPSAVISLEHSIQPWPEFRELFDEARQAFDLQLCFDPCNLWLCDSQPSVSAIVHSVPVAQIAMLHVKQRAADSPVILPGLIPDGSDSGCVPWPSIIRQLQQSGYRGPVLLETAPCTDMAGQIRSSSSQLEEWLGASPDSITPSGV